MPTYYINYTLLSTGRANIRKEIIDLFKKELPGTGTGEYTSKYIYTVESFENYQIILKRPALFNKGFDFVVQVETPTNDKIFLSKSGMTAQKIPTHDNITDVLKHAKETEAVKYDVFIKPILLSLFKGESFDLNSPRIPLVFTDHNNQAHPIEIILLAIKWLFIEQDITYWNWSGRHMLYNYLVVNDLV